jgi:hypothetical protein
MHEQAVTEVVAPDGQQVEGGTEAHLEVELQSSSMRPTLEELQDVVAAQAQVGSEVLAVDDGDVVVWVLALQAIADGDQQHGVGAVPALSGGEAGG